MSIDKLIELSRKIINLTDKHSNDFVLGGKVREEAYKYKKTVKENE
tara:strand:+ start:133 stop:270 length:138 start_codon:yes stop_codon:yes gene_type:complete